MPIAHAEKLLFSALGLTKLPRVTKYLPEKENKDKEEKKIEIKEEEIKDIVDDKVEEEKKKIV